MATAYTDTVLNYSGLLYSTTDNNTRLLDAVFTRGKAFGDGIFGIGRRKVNSIQFALSSGFDVGDGSQPAISEQSSTVAPNASPVTRNQQDNCIQIFQDSVDVSYLKQSANGTMAGLNIAGQANNVPNELDFQISAKMLKQKKDLNYTLINGAYQAGANSSTAWKSRGLVAGITTNVIAGASMSGALLNNGITAAIANGFVFDGGRMELWCNPSDLNTINSAFSSASGFGLPASRTEGGLAITKIMTNFGEVVVNYDANITAGTYLLLNMGELAIAELDLPGKGNFFYEALAKTGAAEKGQIYGQAGIDYGAEWKHIQFIITSSTATISGTVKAGATAIEGATVTLKEKFSGTTKTGTSAASTGAYTISSVAAGVYDVTVAADGYTYAGTTIIVAGENQTLNIAVTAV